MEQQHSNGRITVRMTAERLRAMDDNDMGLYHTPGSSQLYWASSPQFQDDRGVATPRDFALAAGFDGFDGFDDGEIFDLTIEVG